MNWKSRVNSVLGDVAGVKLVRADAPDTARAAAPAPAKRTQPRPAGKRRRPSTPGERRRFFTKVSPDMVRPPSHPELDRLLRRPVFVLSPVRSGSTLLRAVLGAHPRLHAPHELHIRRLTVQYTTSLSEKSMAALGHNQADLEHLLWDRVMHRELTRSGKEFFVDKTPSNAFAYARLATAWPDARFIFLVRHPGSIADSWAEASAGRRTYDEAVLDALRYMRAVQEARENLSGITVRYEDLTGSPEETTRRICDFLDVDWEPTMLQYGSEGVFDKGLGDWKEKILSGQIQPGRELPEASEVPAPVREIARTWGYVS